LDRKLFELVDEIQYLANPSSFMKLIADHHPQVKLIVSGSSSFEMKSKFTVSLVGRTVNFEIYPLSFREMLAFRGISYFPDVPLSTLKIDELRALYLEYALYGGYPKIVLTADLERKGKYLQQIIDTYIRKDIRDLADIRDIQRFNRLLEILASQSGNLLNITEISNTCGLARQTVERYLFLLEQTYILRLVRPFSRNIRTELSKTPKVFFYDTGLMQMLWLKSLQKELLGAVFETSLFAELIKTVGKERVHYWRTADKKEIDFIVEQRQGALPLEVKLHFPHMLPKVLKSFAQSAASARAIPAHVISLYGDPTDPGMIYPWQLNERINPE
jgi:hypothetical protein